MEGKEVLTISSLPFIYPAAFWSCSSHYSPSFSSSSTAKIVTWTSREQKPVRDLSGGFPLRSRVWLKVILKIAVIIRKERKVLALVDVSYTPLCYQQSPRLTFLGHVSMQLETLQLFRLLVHTCNFHFCNYHLQDLWRILAQLHLPKV